MAGLEAHRSGSGHEPHRPSSGRRRGKEFGRKTSLHTVGSAGEKDPKK